MPIDKAKINQLLTEIDDRTAMIRAELEETVVATSEGLVAALLGGGTIELAEGRSFDGDFNITVPTEVFGLGRNMVTAADVGNAWDVRLGVRQAQLANMTLQAPRNEIVVQVGRNTTEQTPENIPREIVLDSLVIRSHRGKRSIEFDASGRITNCEITDSYDPEGIENQAIWLGNTTGPVDVVSCHVEGASQCLMVGGDDSKMAPGVYPTGIRLIDCVFTKPLAWKDANFPKVKTLIEFKNGVDVIVSNCELSNCWRSGQDGYAIVITPRRKGIVRNLLLENLKVSNVAAIANITGFDDPYPELPRTTVRFFGGDYQCRGTALGGRGCFALITNGPEEVRIQQVNCDNDGSSFVIVGDSDPVGLLEIVDSTWNYGEYGVFINGQQAGNNDAGIVRNLIIERNTIKGAKAAFKARYPNNTYV